MRLYLLLGGSLTYSLLYASLSNTFAIDFLNVLKKIVVSLICILSHLKHEPLLLVAIVHGYYNM